MSFNALFSPVLLLAFVTSASIAQEDRLLINRTVPGERLVVMMNAGASSVTGCLGSANRTEWVLRSLKPTRSTGSIDLGNLAHGCTLEIAIFSKNRAMSLETDIKKSTAAPGETLTVTLRPRIKVPVSVWIADKTALDRARADMKNAERIYKQNKVGVRFVPKYHKVWANPTAMRIIGKGVVVTDVVNIRCTDDISELQQSAYYTAGRLNVYYVTGDFSGRNCAIKNAPQECNCPCARAKPSDGDGNITYIGGSPLFVNRATLAHELGHALGLRPASCGAHTDDAAGFRDDNIMWGGGNASRNSFSVGQAFRMNTQSDKWDGTMLIRNGLRPAKDRRECDPALGNNKCPALSGPALNVN